MSLDYIFPDHSKRNHKIAIAVEVTLAVFGLILIFWAISNFWVSPKEEVVEVPVLDLATQRQEWLAQSNSGPALTEDQVTNRKEFIEKVNLSSERKLTPEQLQVRKSFIDNI